MKVALVHDQLLEFGGAERVLVALKNIYPEADVYTSFYDPERLGIHTEQLKDWNIRTSWADRVPGMRRLYSPLRWITPYIWESFDFKGYDLVISSSGGYMCKGIITRPETLHICYLHHQPRYLYYYETALEWQKYWPVKVYGHMINHPLRQWDYISSQRPDFFITNSEETKRRIQKFYRRDSAVIYPPVEIPTQNHSHESGNPSLDPRLRGDEKQGYYLTVSRLARAKHIDILIEAANTHKFNLKIVGSGRDAEYLKSLAGPTVEFLGSVTDDEIGSLYAGAKAFLFASVDEEFGIAPVEAMGHGVPVIAFASGGLPETVHQGKNGYLYKTLSAEALGKEIQKFEALSGHEAHAMRQHARQTAELYSTDHFKKKIQEFIHSKHFHARASGS